MTKHGVAYKLKYKYQCLNFDVVDDVWALIVLYGVSFYNYYSEELKRAR